MLGAFSVTPLGATDSVGDIVAGCVKIVRESGLAHETTAMFTTVEGDPADVFAVIQRCIDYAARYAPRVSVVAKFDHRPGHDDMLASKVARVETVLREGNAPAYLRPEHD